MRRPNQRQMEVLRYIEDSGGSTASEVPDPYSGTINATQAMLRRLARGGWLQQGGISTHSREVVYTTTEAAHKLLTDELNTAVQGLIH